MKYGTFQITSKGQWKEQGSFPLIKDRGARDKDKFAEASVKVRTGIDKDVS